MAIDWEAAQNPIVLGVLFMLVLLVYYKKILYILSYPMEKDKVAIRLEEFIAEYKKIKEQEVRELRQKYEQDRLVLASLERLLSVTQGMNNNIDKMSDIITRIEVYCRGR
ncbi:hypothetical protein D6827_03160 [Candidatus Parcubacteria bacterium]|nr:MAG: hypothetical protein D6827_03160 [Candidatus Parcubacteria bacterium]